MPEAVFVHPHAIVEPGAGLGPGCRVWAFAHILGGARLGADCNICDHVFIENDVVIGSRVTVKPGVQVWDGVTLQDDVFVGPNATFTNDAFPRSGQRPAQFARTLVGQGASIGANATILPGLTIGQQALVGAGAVVTRDVPPNAIVRGNPAQIVGYVAAGRGGRARPAPPPDDPGGRVSGARSLALGAVTDLRGSLCFGQYDDHLPFLPRRFFVVSGVPTREVRGEHAHRECEQVLVCLAGACRVVADDSRDREEFVLDAPSRGLYLGPMVWSTQFHFSSDCVLLVLASQVYRAEDYIRNYDEFLRAARAHER